MNNLLDFIILFVKQFAGGPGPVENNLVRFGLPAAMWAVLFFVAWSRQHDQDLPRERLLVWGFGLAFLREFYMFIQMVRRLMSPEAFEVSCQVVQPFEHALAMAAMTVVAGAYLRYALGNPRISQVYVRVGLAVTAAVFIFSSITWPAQMASNPQLQFHQTQSAWYFHVPLSIMLGGAVLMLLHRREWLRIVVGVALFFYLLSEMLLLFNYATDRTFNSFVCPVGNMLHILVDRKSVV